MGGEEGEGVVTTGRLTPPSIQDGPYGFEPGSLSNFEQSGEPPEKFTPRIAQRLGVDNYESSTNWLNAGRRASWNDSLRAFQNKHATNSKYLSRDYAFRSNLYLPKTRTMVRNDEAQTASAFFANEDVVSISPGDESDQFQVASAEMLQALVQYRLTKTIPWFLLLVGARQDAEVQGICCARVGWEYEEKVVGSEEQPVMGPDGAPMFINGESVTEKVDVTEKVKDRPFGRLLPPENLRFDPGADWTDVVGTSPYLIEMIPMYVQDVQMRMDSGEWFRIADSALRSAGDGPDDVTRRSRESGRVPGKDSDAWKPRPFDVVWVRRNIVRWYGEDWHYYSIGGAGELLTDPEPLADVELHGQRPYVVGFVVLETHKTYPSSKVEITTDLQRASNDDWNLRFDNVKLSLNPRQFVRAGFGLENQDLTRFAPGKVVTITGKAGEPIQGNVVTWDRPPPPDASAYAEQDRINLAWDELTGAFTNSSIQASQIQQQSATGMNLMSGIASGMNEYELRVFAETFVEPFIRLLVKLEQAYETDPVVLALCGRKAQLLQKYGLNVITDELLNQEVTTRVNVGIGATNPSMKMRNLSVVGQMLGSMFGPIAAQGIDFQEAAKEAFALAGYKDGERFIKKGFDPRVEMLQQQIQKLQGKGQAAKPPDMSKVEAARVTSQGRITEQVLQNLNDKRSDEADMSRQMMEQQAENWREWLKTQHEQYQMMYNAHQEANRPPEIRASRFRAR